MKRLNNKGLSTIIATLIIILLVFVAVAILWVVVRGFISGGTGQLDLSSKCIDSIVTPTKVNNTATGVYQVTVFRERGEDEIGGIKLIFTGEAENANYIQDVPGNIPALSLTTVDVTIQDVTDPDKVEAVIYYVDGSGNQQYCQGGESLEF